MFNKFLYTGNISEGSQFGTSVVEITATDSDFTSENQEIYFT